MAGAGELYAVVGEGRIEVSSTEIPDDWADRWRDLRQAPPGRRAALAAPLLVGPVRWGTIDVIVVDPGEAFGTGAHPTTRLSSGAAARAGGGAARQMAR